MLSPTRPSSATERSLAVTLQALYDRERAVYQALKRHGSIQTRPSRQLHSVAASDIWTKLVRFCTRRSIDPVGYMLWRFEAALPGRAPEPRQFLDPIMADAYRTAQAKEAVEAEAALRVQQQTARTRIMLACRRRHGSREDAWAAVLTDESLALSALFRYCLACSVGGDRFVRIAHIYADDAARQYRRHPAAYDTTWGRWIPQELRDRCQERIN